MQGQHTLFQSGPDISAETRQLLRVAFDALDANNNVVSYQLHFHENPNRETMLQAQVKCRDAHLARQQAGISFESVDGCRAPSLAVNVQQSTLNGEEAQRKGEGGL